ncbi:SET domain-containing protein-lysine N-methyltransferase [Marinicella meishanensis]|uniref:SET domain-containing protein-lysine N-methyltransferase n=1 Tax=Marinicella meishanensis TaxID=2873263 RepID=UPI001CC13720|nr:SET domain-containing protein-lysine N-methyltransferase [Marinicella sp. NBU2979]
MLYPKEFGSDPLFPQASDFKCEFKDHWSGQGIMTLKAFKKGDTIAKLAGEVVNSMREHTFQIGHNKHLLDDYFAGHFLHSCDPNASINTKDRKVVALKIIQAGEFISIDYTHTEDYLFRQFNCRCGSKKCRKVIAGKKEIPRSSLTVSGYYGDDDY